MSNVVKNIISGIVLAYARVQFPICFCFFLSCFCVLFPISTVYKRAMFGCRAISYLLLFLFFFLLLCLILISTVYKRAMLSCRHVICTAIMENLK